MIANDIFFAEFNGNTIMYWLNILDNYALSLQLSVIFDRL